jgi:hypothetical protein
MAKANKKKSIYDRSYRYQFSEIEKTIMFDRENLGFVRSIHRENLIFYLDPSRFLYTPYYEVYVIRAGPSPSPGDLIEVSIDSIEEQMINGILYSVKNVKTWKRIDPKTLIKNKKNIYPHELLWYFSVAYRNNDEDLKRVALGSVLSLLSAPQGGINTTVFSDNQGWNAFKRTITSVLPPELLRIGSPYFYKISETDTSCPYRGGIESSYSVHSPGDTVMHNPFTIDCETKSTGWYRESQECYEPFIIAYLIDSILYRPEILPEHENFLIEKIYELMNLHKINNIPCRFDLGGSLQRAAASISRLFAERDAGRNEIKLAFDLLEDMITTTSRLYSTRYPPQSTLELESSDWKLHFFISNGFGKDIWIPEILVINELGKISITLDQYHESFRRLNICGLIIKNSKGDIRLLE